MSEKNTLKKRKIQLIIRHVEATVLILLLCAVFVINMTGDKEALREKGVNAYNTGNYSEALEYFNQAYSETQWFTQKMDADILMYMADSYLKLNMYNEALDTYQRVRDEYLKYTEADKVNDMINIAEALILVRDGDCDEAVPKLSAAVDSGYTEINMYLGGCYRTQGSYESMLGCYDAYLSQYPMNTYIAYQLSSYYLETEPDYEKAHEYISMGLGISGDEVYREELRLNEIIYYEKLTNYEEAFHAAEQFVSDYPENEAGQAEYDFLYSRVNIDPIPVHIDPDYVPAGQTE